MTSKVWASLWDKLGVLQREGGHNIFQRLKIASRLLSDPSWLSSQDHGGGNETTAIPRLYSQGFTDTGLPLPDLLQVYREFPDEDYWKQKNYHLAEMVAEMKARQRAARPPRPDNPDKTLAPWTREEDLQGVVRLLRAENAQLRKELTQVRLLRAENAQLRKKLAQRDRELARIKKRLASI